MSDETNNGLISAHAGEATTHHELKEKVKFAPVEVLADGCRFYGPKVDKSYTLSFSCGEYAKLDLAKLFMLPEGKVIKLTIEVIDK